MNKVIIAGRLGKDPETRATTTGNSVVNVSVATSEKWTDKTSGQKQEKTEWHNVVCFGRTGDLVAQYLTKGSMAIFEGKIQTRSWDNKDGVKQYRTEIVADRVEFLGGGDASRQTQPYQEPTKAADIDDNEIPF